MAADDKNSFRRDLLSQDPPPPDDGRIAETLSTVRRRLRVERAIASSVYVALFSAAFAAFMKSDRAQETASAVMWGTISYLILAWFLVCVLWRVQRMAARIAFGAGSGAEAVAWKRQDRFVGTVGAAIAVISCVLLGFLVGLADPLRAAKLSAQLAWAPVFFLFWYPFGTLTLLGRLFVAHRRAELLAVSREDACEDKAGPRELTIP